MGKCGGILMDFVSGYPTRFSLDSQERLVAVVERGEEEQLGNISREFYLAKSYFLWEKTVLKTYPS